jgi:3-deoxy-manno-octulosonate cytidylyltransferase (CMP-KDO synthetase)
MLEFLLVIPSRYNSSRLPGKPLININGIPMIIRTCIQCSKAVSRKNIVVATDDKRIFNLVKSYGYNSIITSKNCKTGTDRVGKVSEIILAKYYINVQGDEPIFNPSDIKKLLIHIKRKHKNVLLGYSKILDKKEINNINIPKVYFNKEKKLIFASRIPLNYKVGNSYYKQILAYSYPRNLLKIFLKNKKKTFFEAKEDIEILRFIELGIDVGLIKMSSKSKSVDVKSDLQAIAKYLK